MSKIAVIKTGGKQYKVKEGDSIKVEKLEVEPQGKIKIETLLVADGDKIEVGKPSLGERVEAEVINTAKGDKVTVVKYKNKTRYKRTIGHRQIKTELKIISIA